MHPSQSLPVSYCGSVKDVLGPVILQNGAHSRENAVVFKYTDQFSVFDWGKMPNSLPQKGEALTLLAGYLFEKLQSPTTWREFSKTPIAQKLRKGVSELAVDLHEASIPKSQAPQSLSSTFNDIGESLQSRGLRSHYLGFFKENYSIDPSLDSSLSRLASESRESLSGTLVSEVPISFQELKAPSKLLAVKQVQVIKPQYKKILGRLVPDYSPYVMTAAPKLIPFEVVFRYSFPEGSSFIERIKKDEDLLNNIPLSGVIDSVESLLNSELSFPVIEIFSKLEVTDRPLSFSEALAISGIRAEVLQEMLLKTAWISGVLKNEIEKRGLKLADGKLEWALDENGSLILVDAIGPDELRILSGNKQLSKEFLRGFYRTTTWYKKTGEAKKRAQKEGVLDWKKKMQDVPPPQLPDRYLKVASQIYKVLTESLTGRKFFKDTWELKELLERFEELSRITEIPFEEV